MHRNSQEQQRDTSDSAKLQDEIRRREKELLLLYERRDAQVRRQHVATKDPRNEKESHEEGRGGKECVGATSRRHELQIQNGPPLTPQSFVATPETVTLPLTEERRRIGHSAQRVAASALPARSPPSEFTARLNRLHHAALAGRMEVHSAACGSLLVSPILRADPRVDASCTDILHDNDDGFFADVHRSTQDSRGSGAGSPRHVRFSSKSPRVALFSVERPCDGAASPEPEEGEVGSVSPFIEGRLNATAEVIASNGEEGRRHCDSLTPLSTCCEVNATLPAVSSISTVLSLRSSVTSYIALLNELRSSLLGSSPRRTTPRRFSAVPQAAAAESGVIDAATPTKEKSLPAVEDGEENGRVTPLPHHTSLNANAPSRVPRPEASHNNLQTSLFAERGSRSVEKEEMLNSVLDSPPIFLQRPERQRVSSPFSVQHLPLPSHGEPPIQPPIVASDTRTRGSKASRSPSLTHAHSRASASHTRLAKRTPPPHVTATRQKKVRFAASLGHPEHDPPLQPAGRRRGRGTPIKPSLPTAGTFGKAPADMCVEQPGFGAGIRLPCGPTLFFD